MSVLLDVNGTEYAYPEVNDTAWGADATDWAVAVTNGMLQKSGGLFLLLADVDFGGNFGLVAQYYKSRSANVASVGALRLATTDAVTFRNFANDGDLSLEVNDSDELVYNNGIISQPVQTAITPLDTATIDLTLAGSDLSADIKSLSITNAMIAAAAAIEFTKLEILTAARALVTSGGGVVSVSAVTATELGYLSGVTSAIQTQLNAKGTGTVTSVGFTVPASSIFAATGSPVTLSGSLGFTTTGASGGIPYFDTTSTLHASGVLTANALIVGGGPGTSPAPLASLGTTSTVLHGNAGGGPTFGPVVLTTDVSGLLPIANGGTNNASLSVAAGAAYYADGSKIVALAPGSAGQVYTSGGAGVPTWSSPLTNPMTTAGDIIVGGVAGAATRLAGGTSQQWLIYGGSAAPVYSNTVTTGKVIDGSADAVQFTVEGNATQTANILDVQKSDTTKLLSVTNVNGTAIRGSTTNDAAAAGFVGEIIQNTQTFTNTAATTVWGDLTSIALTAGTWLIHLFGNATRAGATVTAWEVGISPNAGTSGSGLSQLTNLASALAPTAGVDTSTSIPGYYVQLAASATYYFKYRATFSAGTPQVAGRLTAHRIR